MKLERFVVKLKNYILNFEIITIITLIVTLTSCVKKEDDHTFKNIKVSSDSNTISSIKSRYNLKADPTILKTDNEGNILGGDMSDWDFVISSYDNFKNYNQYFFPPKYKDSGYIYIGDPESMFSEINGNTVTLSWIATKLDTKEFIIERKNLKSETWEKIGKVDSEGYSNLETEFKFVDHNIEDGIYNYRLKYSYEGYDEYYNLPHFVIAKEKDDFEFYPAFPNPVVNTFNISFYLPVKDIVSIYFLNDKDTSYILDHEPQERGFYKLTIDKNSLGFENEIKRLFINCKYCNNKKNYGDIQF